MRILMISLSFPPEANPEAIVTAKLTRALVEAGAEVTVVGRDLYPGEEADRSRCWEGGLGRIFRLHAPRYPRKAANYMAKLRRRDRDASWFSTAALDFCLKLCGREKFDVVMSRSGNLDSVEVAYRLKQRFGLKWLASITDPAPFCFYPPPYGPGRAENLFHRLQTSWTRDSLARADRVIFPSAHLADYLEEVWGIELGVRKMVAPHIGWPPAGKYERGKYFEVLHSGTLDLHRGRPEFFSDIAKVIGKFPGLGDRVRIVLAGRVQDELRGYLEERKIDGLFRFEPLGSFEDSIETMGRAGALLLLEARLSRGVFLPSKFCDYAVAGRPLLLGSPKTGTISDMVGGFAHPGFMGQVSEENMPVLERFFGRVARNEGLEDYVCPEPERFGPERVARLVLAAAGSEAL